jgi:hypothetical protein
MHSIIGELIADNSSGFGDQILEDKEKILFHARRLNLLLQDPDVNIRCKVEVRLGRTDESHIA